jgi:Ni,Fe-hydrogenase III large subunit
MACSVHARVLADVLRRAPALAARARAIAVAADAARDGLDHDHRFGNPGGLRSVVPDDERHTLVRRVDDLRRAAARIGDNDVDDALAWLRGAGGLEVERCRELGIDGPTLLATGALSPLPADLGDWLGRQVVGTSGCAVARSLTHQAELRAAVARLVDRVAAVPPTSTPPPRLRPETLRGTASAVVRGPNGSCAVHVVVEGGVVRRLRLRPPDLPLLAGVARALRGVRLDDVSEVFASFGLRASAIDR